jgi:hypothetical protein
MKRALMFVLMVCAVSLWADELKAGAPGPSEVIHVATALDHLTVLEFGEPVTMAAAGSAAFQIERHEDKVFLKPLKAGASTDLFVWTASRRFTYELEAPGEVKNMNFAVDNRIPEPKPAPANNPHLEEIADMMLTRALLGAERVDSSSIKEEKGRVTVKIDRVFQAKNTLYIQYSVSNQSRRPYRVVTPNVAEALAPHTTVSIMSLQRTQVDEQFLRKLGELRERSLTPARTEIGKEDLQPGEETQGVIAIRERVSGPTIFQLTFGPEGSRKVQATMVL